MTRTEFYETYVKIRLPNREYVLPPPLTDEQRKVYDKAEELDCDPYLMIRGRKGIRIIINPIIEELLKNKK